MIEPVILDKLVPKTIADKIELLLIDENFPWIYLKDITYGDNTYNSNKFVGGFTYVAYDKKTKLEAKYSDLFNLIPTYALPKENITIFKTRAFMHEINKNPYEYDNIHIDFSFPHTVCLYYVTDSEADTFLFGYEKNDLVYKRVQPKKGRILLFDGLIYHASSTPKEGKRIVLNFDLKNLLKESL